MEFFKALAIVYADCKREVLERPYGYNRIWSRGWRYHRLLMIRQSLCRHRQGTCTRFEWSGAYEDCKRCGKMLRCLVSSTTKEKS